VLNCRANTCVSGAPASDAPSARLDLLNPLSAPASSCRSSALPFLALSVHQRAANGGKQRHNTKAEHRLILRVGSRD
jgi:hypothetical protein